MNEIVRLSLCLFSVILSVGLAGERPLNSMEKSYGQGIHRALVKGVKSVHLGEDSIPGETLPVGRKACSVIVGGAKGNQSTIVAAAKYKAGRVITFGHGGVVSDVRNQVFMKNCLNWLGRPSLKKMKVYVIKDDKLFKAMVALGVKAKKVNSIEEAKAADVIVLWLPTHKAIINESNAENLAKELNLLRTYVGKGKGLIYCDLGWVR